MLNIERYKNKLGTKTTELEFEIQLLMGNKPSCDKKSCHICRKECIEWLLSEYKEPILTEEEKAYLSALIKPFRKFVVFIKKLESKEGWEKIAFYSQNLKSWECMTNLPPFQSGTRFEGMKLNKQYKLEELGL